MNIRDLEYFVALAKLKHFGQAAQACHVSQPTLSAQVKKLEEYVGSPLFERSSKSVLLTPVGDNLVPKAQALLLHYKDFLGTAQAMCSPFMGKVEVGAIPTIAPYLFPKLVSEVQVQKPELELNLYEFQTEVALQKIQAGDLDCAILALPWPLSSNLLSLPLLTEPLYLAASRQNPLSAKASVSVSDVANLPILLLEEGHCLRDHIVRFCDQFTQNAVPGFQGTSLETLRQMVKLNRGVTLMPELAVVSSDPDIAYVPFIENSHIQRELVLVTRASHPRMDVLKFLQSLLRVAS